MNKQIFTNDEIKALQTALFRVWREIAPDAGDCDHNEDALELCLDANRLERVSRDLGRLVDERVKEHGYRAVLKELNKRVMVL